MNRALKTLRKLAIGLTGFVVLIIGLVLIPLPGPGVLVTFAGLAILALEFEWARHHKEKVQGHVNKLLEKARTKQEELKKKREP